MNEILEGNFSDALANRERGCCSLIYIDPPYNTGMTQRLGQLSYKDKRTAVEWTKLMKNAIACAEMLLKEDGSLFIHCDWHCQFAIRCLVELGANSGDFTLMNEIIWAYDFGGRPKKWWPRKHDTILWYVKDPENYTFNFDEMDRIPYMAPGLVGPEKAAKGKTPTDVWWHTIVHTTGKERTGYPTQKPLGVLERIVKVHSNPGDTIIDFFAGSGTTGEAAAKHDRQFVLVDNNPQAVEVMTARLQKFLTG